MLEQVPGLGSESHLPVSLEESGCARTEGQDVQILWQVAFQV